MAPRGDKILLKFARWQRSSFWSFAMQELRNDEVLHKPMAYEVVESHDLGKFACSKLRHKYDDWGSIR